MTQAAVQERDTVDVTDPNPNARPIVPPVKSDPLSLSRLSDMAPAQIDAAVERIERAAAGLRRLTQAAIQFSRPHDWQQFGDTMYLEGEGAMRIAPAIGMQVGAPEFNKEVVGDDIFVECLLEVSWPAMGSTFMALGTCDTRDDFWDNEKERSQINQFRDRATDEAQVRRMLLGFVMKKAHMNAIGRGVSLLLGIHGLKVSDFEAMGFTPGGAKIDFKKGATRASTKEAKAAPQNVTIAKAIELPIGSLISFKGIIVTVSKSAKFHKYQLIEQGKSINVIKWTEDALPAWAARDEIVYCDKVAVREYQGNKQYVAEGIMHASDAPPEQQAPAPTAQTQPAASEQPV